MKLVQLYEQIKEESKILVPRRSPEEREKNFLIATNKKIQEYIKNGSKGDLDLYNTPITSLPNNLTYVGGDLRLSNSKIASLQNGLTIGGDLIISNTPITSLPKDLKVGDTLWLGDTPLSKKYTREQIKQMVPGVKGEIIYV